MRGVVLILVDYAADSYDVSGFGHDKSEAILPYLQLDPAPTVFFFGDGVSGECRNWLPQQTPKTKKRVRG
jgi:hypothetical protein